MLVRLFVIVFVTFPIWLYGNIDLENYGSDSIITDDNVPRLGYSLASGDFNKDGYDDVVVGYRGGLYLYYGSSVGLGIYSFDTLKCVPKSYRARDNRGWRYQWGWIFRYHGSWQRI